jgi:hydrogenase maturation protein HypF
VSQRIRTAVRVEGVVQGVGFRPFVYSLATSLGLGGLVGNDVDGVFAEVEGPRRDHGTGQHETSRHRVGHRGVGQHGVGHRGGGTAAHLGR